MLFFKQKEICPILFEDLMVSINARNCHDFYNSNLLAIKRIQFYFEFSNVLDFFGEDFFEYALFLYLMTGQGPVFKDPVSRLHRGKRYYSLKLMSEIKEQLDIWLMFGFLRHNVLYSDLSELVYASEEEFIVKSDKIHDLIGSLRLSSSFYTKQLYKSLYIRIEFQSRMVGEWILNVTEMDDGN